jgi:gliding motility-associated lipoprotein GldH
MKALLHTLSASWYSRLTVMASLGLLLTSCDTDRLYETNLDVIGNKWSYTDAKIFIVDVPDTTSRYHLYINVRHGFNYEWRNMYLHIETTFPDGKKMDKRVSLPLCEADGKWFGSCLGDNCDIPVMIQHDAKFPMRGKYTFKLTQDMRVNPLASIKSIGLRVVKSESVHSADKTR